MSIAHTGFGLNQNLNTTSEHEGSGSSSQTAVSRAAVSIPAKTAAAPAKIKGGAETPKDGCPHCGTLDSWGIASWCPRCGYYPALGTWTETHPTSDEQPISRALVITLVPAWAWILLSGLIVTLVLSVAGRLLTPDDGWERTIWALCQLGIALGCFLAMHTWCYFVAVIRSDRFGVFDYCLKPFGIWMVSVNQLPKSKVRIWIGAWALSAAFLAMTVVGGIRYSIIFDDWGIRGPGDKQTMDLVAKKANQERPKESLEDSVKAFSDKVKIQEDKDDKQKVVKRKSVDCVVIGYTEDESGEGFKDLIIAAVHDDQLRYVGSVAEGISDAVGADLMQRLRKIHREKPFVRCRVAAKWVDPVVMCRVSFENWNEQQLLSSAAFDKLLMDAQ